MKGVSLQLAPEEPEAVPWHAELLSTVIETVMQGRPGKLVVGRPVVLAVDGRSNSGKTTLAGVQLVRPRRCAAPRADTSTLPVRVSFRERFGRSSFEDFVETASLKDGPGGLTPKRLSSR